MENLKEDVVRYFSLLALALICAVLLTAYCMQDNQKKIEEAQQDEAAASGHE